MVLSKEGQVNEKRARSSMRINDPCEEMCGMPRSLVVFPDVEIPICGDCGGRVDPGLLSRYSRTTPMKTLARHLLDYLLVIALLALVLLVVASSASIGSWLAVSGN